MIGWVRRNRSAGSVPAVFLHIQKTAGTSLVNVARRYYGNDVVSHGDCWGTPPEQFRRIRFISGHLGYAYMQSFMKERYSFTFLRDPAERILSMYYFCRSRDPSEFAIYRKAHEMELAEFLEAGYTDPIVRGSIWNNQVWQLAHGYTNLDAVTLYDFSAIELLELAKKHLLEFSHIGFTETFSSDADIICRALKFPEQGPGQTILKENANPNRPTYADQPTTVRALLKRMTELDRQLYSYARNEFVAGPRKQFARWSW